MIKNCSIKIGVKIKPKPNNISNPIQIIASSNRNPKNQKESPMVFLKMPDQTHRQFCVDAVHDANQSSATTFTDLHIDHFVSKFIDGFNVTLMAYGQTGAGKTYTMQGGQNQLGIVTQSIRMIYKRMGVQQGSHDLNSIEVTNPTMQAKICCSYIQLYNQKIHDLLGQEKIPQEGFKLRWQADRDFIVEDLSFHYAKNAKEMERIWKRGTKKRIVASNTMHDLSSRSHSLFSIVLSDKDQEGNYRSREMTFVDLAGSERLFDSVGKLNKESVEINKSLFVLRKVIKLLEESSTQKKNIYIPYRDSKLTSLLKKSLGGNCLTMMIACIDPTAEQKQQTLLTLNYAISTGHIFNSARINIDPQIVENKQLKQQNQKLRKQLDIVCGQLNIFQKERSSEIQKKYMGEYSHKIIECIGTIRQLIKSNKQLREQLDEERKVRKQQQIQIEMLMEQKILLKRNQSLKKQKQTSRDYSLQTIKERQGISPKKLKQTQDSLNKFTQSIYSPNKFVMRPPRNNSNSNSIRKNRESSIIKRKSFIVHKTEPTQQARQ